MFLGKNGKSFVSLGLVAEFAFQHFYAAFGVFGHEGVGGVFSVSQPFRFFQIFLCLADVALVRIHVCEIRENLVFRYLVRIFLAESERLLVVVYGFLVV